MERLRLREARDEMLALGAACSLPFLTPTPSWNRRYVGAHTTKFNATSPQRDDAWSAGEMEAELVLACNCLARRWM